MKESTKKRLFAICFILGFILALVIGCGHIPEMDTTQPEKPGIETTEIELGALTVKINFGETSTSTRMLGSGEQSSLIEAQKSKVQKIYCSLYNSKNCYSGIINRDADSAKNSHTFENIEQGSYKLYISCSHSIENHCYNLFSGEKQVTVHPGQNEPIAISLHINEWQPILMSLPEEYSGEENGFSADFQIKRGDNTENCGTWLKLHGNNILLHGLFSLNISEVFELKLNGGKYVIDADDLFSALINDQPVSLSECIWEPTASVEIQIEFSDKFADEDVSLVITRNALSTDGTILANQKDVVFSSWNFDATDSVHNIRITSILWYGQGTGAVNTDSLCMFIDHNKNGQWDEEIDEILYPIRDGINSQADVLTFALDKPVEIPGGTSIHICLKGDKNGADCNECIENWGLVSTTSSVIAYDIETGNAVTEKITPDVGPILTTINHGTIKIRDRSPYDSRNIVSAGSTDNFLLNTELYAENEMMNTMEITFEIKDGNYECNTEIVGDYKDISSVSVYGRRGAKITSFSFPSTGLYTVYLQQNDLKISNDPTTLIVKPDMATIDADLDNAPGTPSADVVIAIKEIKAAGQISNRIVTIQPEIESKTVILRKTKVYLKPPIRDTIFGAATILSNGDICIYAYGLTANTNGNAFIYKKVFQTDVLNSNIVLSNPRLEDENGNIIAQGKWERSGNTYKVAFVGFDNPDFESGLPEAVEIPGGEDRIFRLWSIVSGAVTGDWVQTAILGDTACSEIGTADQVEGNFIWSDNYCEISITDAVNAKQWYNGHLLFNNPAPYYLYQLTY